MNEKRKGATARLCRLALLSALALALSALEGIFTPILPPGVRAGLSNVVTMYAVASLGLPSALTVTLLKALFALLTRGVIAFGMSALGGLLSATLLYILFRFAKGKLGTVGISVLGAAAHNLAQGLFALLIFGRAMLAYLPILVLLSAPCGLVTGSLLYLVRYRRTQINSSPKGEHTYDRKNSL